MPIELQDLVDAFGDSLGEGKAEQIVQEAKDDAAVGYSEELSEEEALAVVDQVVEREDISSFVEVTANTLKTRIRAGNVGS